MKKILIIAEAGVNHNGSLKIAKDLVDAAKAAGADIVKFQNFIPRELASASAQMAAYQRDNIGKEVSQLSMLEKLTLTNDETVDLFQYCRKIGITPLSTPFDMKSLHFLSTLDMPFWKIPSGEITNYPYLVEIARTGRPVVMSTGMATMEEVGSAIDILLINGTNKEDLTILQCNTQYPTPYEDVNLNAMLTMKHRFDLRVGYSDHTLGIEIPIAAAALGASVIEKHFTLDRGMEGPDHKASLEPDELKSMVEGIRHVESALGNGEKSPSPSEADNLPIVRKSIIAKKHINKGELLSEENLTTKRPGYGISPMNWNKVIGTQAVRDFEEDELIEL